MDSSLDALQQKIGHRFADPALMERALTHRSYGADHNERLEFLGDALLGAVDAEYLYRHDPVADEGQLTRHRVAIVRAETLVRWAREIGIQDALYLGTGERVTEDGIFTVEAPTPAIVSVTEKANTPRVPNFKGIMAAKKKTIRELGIGDIGVAAENVGLGAAATKVTASAPKAAKTAGEIVTDEGNGVYAVGMLAAVGPVKAVLV